MMCKDKDDSLAVAGEKGEPIFLHKHLTSERHCIQCGRRFVLDLGSDDKFCSRCLADYYRMVAEE